MADQAHRSISSATWGDCGNVPAYRAARSERRQPQITETFSLTGRATSRAHSATRDDRPDFGLAVQLCSAVAGAASGGCSSTLSGVRPTGRRLLAEDTHFGIGLVDLHEHLVEVLHERLELFGLELRQVERHARLVQFRVGPAQCLRRDQGR
jgi:hypothetical protein